MNIVHILSGGLDSTTLLYKYLKEGHFISCLSFNYGQKHQKELELAEQICLDTNTLHHIIDISNLSYLFGNNSLSGSIPVPNGHYTEPSMKNTVVPNRNMIMLSLAAAYAISEKYDTISYGAHAGDHEIYPDCRPKFIETMKKAFSICDWHELTLISPFANINKTEIVKIGLNLGVPYQKTWTCYNGQDIPCRTCGSCVEREEAFINNNTIDPLLII